MKEWGAVKKEYYGKNMLVITDYGLIDFSREGMSEVRRIGKLSYDKYLDAQKNSFGKARTWLQECYFSGLSRDFVYCQGKIEKKTKTTLCFKRLYLDTQVLDFGFGIYPNYDGGFFGTEDHVWMSLDGFEKYNVGDCISFVAEVYRYLKTKNGIHIDYGLENPTDIEQINEYELPSEGDFARQTANNIYCNEICMFKEHCDGMSGIVCLANENERTYVVETLTKKLLNDTKK